MSKEPGQGGLRRPPRLRREGSGPRNDERSGRRSDQRSGPRNEEDERLQDVVHAAK